MDGDGERGGGPRSHDERVPVVAEGGDAGASGVLQGVALDPLGGVPRIIVVTPTRTSESYLDRIYDRAEREQPAALSRFEETVDLWCDGYSARFADASLIEVDLITAVYWFDQTHERVVAAYGISSSPVGPRDVNRMRSFPDVSVGVTRRLGAAAFAVDRGHFLSHASGGELDINLFPQRRELNRGWSEQGKRFRRMEREAADRPGTFHYHRASYDDDTWIPATLEYGVLRRTGEWWIAQFDNKAVPAVDRPEL